MTVSAAVMSAAERERAVGRDQRERVRGREVLLGHEVRHRRVLRRAPEQGEDLDEERDDDQQPEAVHERQRRDQRGPPEVAADHHLAPVEPVDDHAAERREEEAGHHPDGDDEAERGGRAVRDAVGQLARMAKNPTQSPRLEKTWASQSLKNGRVPKSRHGAGGIECSSEEGGMKGAGSGLTHSSD